MTPTLGTNHYRIGPRITIWTIKQIVEYCYPVQCQLLPQYSGHHHGPLLCLQIQEVRCGGPLQPLQVMRGVTPLSRMSGPHQTIPWSLAVSAQFLWFQISTFDKTRFPRSLILPLESPYPRYHLYFYPLMTHASRQTRTRRQEPIKDIPELSTGDNNKLVLQYDATNI